MTKKYTKLLFVNSDFFLKEKTKFVKVKAIPLNVLEMDFFLYQNKIKFWCVVEGITGIRVTKYYKNIILAKKELDQVINHKTKSQVENKIFLFLKSNRLSPRYRFIANPCRKYVATNQD